MMYITPSNIMHIQSVSGSQPYTCTVSELFLFVGLIFVYGIVSLTDSSVLLLSSKCYYYYYYIPRHTLWIYAYALTHSLGRLAYGYIICILSQNKCLFFHTDFTLKVTTRLTVPRMHVMNSRDSSVISIYM